MSLTTIHNPYDFPKAGCPVTVAGSGDHADAVLVILRPDPDSSKSWYRKTTIAAPASNWEDKERKNVMKGWRSLLTSTGVADWLYIPSMDCYVPASFDLSKVQRTVRRKGKDDTFAKINGQPVEFGPCGVGMAKDQGRWTSFSTCWRPRASAAGKCSFHEKSAARAAEKDQKFRESLAEAVHQWDRDEENARRANEALVVLRAAVIPLGIHPDQLDTADGKVRLQPEVAETLAQYLIEYDELRNL